MFKKALFPVACLFIASNVFAECYILSPDGQTFSRTPERMCINANGDAYSISWEVQNPGRTEKFGEFFNVALLKNEGSEKIYGTTTENSLFRAFSVKINSDNKTISIGKSTLFYRLDQ